MKTRSQDIKSEIFKTVLNKTVVAVITAKEEGIIAGADDAEKKAIKLGLDIEKKVSNGSFVKSGDIIFKIKGSPKQIAEAEDALIGAISKASGIATATYKAVKISEGKIRIVSGAWKKMPVQIKQLIKKSVVTGGGCAGISEEPFIYIDKNCVRIFGGIKESLSSVKLGKKLKAVQLKGETKRIEDEAVEAAKAGANILMIDTGKISDIEMVSKKLNHRKMRNRVKIAFAGGIKIPDLNRLKDEDVDIVELGRSIVDAPLLDLSLDVIAVE